VTPSVCVKVGVLRPSLGRSQGKRSGGWKLA